MDMDVVVLTHGMLTVTGTKLKKNARILAFQITTVLPLIFLDHRTTNLIVPLFMEMDIIFTPNVKKLNMAQLNMQNVSKKRVKQVQRILKPNTYN